MSRTNRRVKFNKKSKAKMLFRYWQYHSEEEVLSFYFRCLIKKDISGMMYEPSFPYRYHSDNYYSKNNRRKKYFIKIHKIKVRQQSNKEIHLFMLGLQDDIFMNEKVHNINRLID